MGRFFKKYLQLLKPGAVIIAGGLYIWVIIILFGNDNWVGISALTTMLLAIAAFWAIRQNQGLQKREHKQRLLNEIIEWAIDVAKCGMESGSRLSEAVVTDPIIPEKMIKSSAILFDLASDIQSEAATLIVRGEYIKNISQVFNKDFQEIVKQAVSHLRKYNETLIIYQNVIPLDGAPKPSDLNKCTAAVKEVFEHKQLVKKSANKLIEDAARIKTKDIGREEEENMSKEGEATVSNEPTLKDIEEHLERQDSKMARGTYFSGYLFGATMIFIAFGLLAGKYILTTELGYAFYAILLLIGGTGMMIFTWCKGNKLPK